MLNEKKRTTAPSNLSESMKTFYKQVVADYQLEPHRLKLLKMACECWDESEKARQELAESGLTFKDKSGQVKAHPANKIATDNRILFARLLREMRLDINDPDENNRLPRIGV
jgi:phage terminase small subunit